MLDLIVDSVLTNAKAYLKGEIVDCSLAIEEGKIQKIGKETQMPKADEKIDLRHMLILPGVIDAHVHLRDQEKAYKETFATGTAAAAAGGVTTVLDMPNNSPVTNTAEALHNRMQAASRRVLVNVGFYSEFPPASSEIDAIVGEGAVGFKLFMGEQVGGLNIDSDQALKEAFTQTAQLGVPVAVHAEDHLLLKSAIERLKRSKRHDMAAFLKAHDERAEFAAVQRLLDLTAATEKARVHFCHVSTPKALELATQAKEAGKQVTCEATPHHLLLTKEDYLQFGQRALTMPPLRTKENVDALWKGINEEAVDIIGSDHAPHTLEEKDANSIWEVKAGIPGLETTLPLVLTQVHKNRLTLAQAQKLLCEKPAEIFGLSGRGRLEQGQWADLAVVDFNQKFKIDASKFRSKAKFSPFNGWEVQGKPVKTFVNGRLALDEGEIVAKLGSGNLIRGAKA
jgi:dihydroorotase (multifunctional complex type)